MAAGLANVSLYDATAMFSALGKFWETNKEATIRHHTCS